MLRSSRFNLEKCKLYQMARTGTQCRDKKVINQAKSRPDECLVLTNSCPGAVYCLGTSTLNERGFRLGAKLDDLSESTASSLPEVTKSCECISRGADNYHNHGQGRLKRSSSGPEFGCVETLRMSVPTADGDSGFRSATL